MVDATDETKDDVMEEILEMLKGYGEVLQRIDGRFDTVDASMELIRNNQVTVNQRAVALEEQVRARQDRLEELLQSMTGRVAALERNFTPVPQLFEGGDV